MWDHHFSQSPASRAVAKCLDMQHFNSAAPEIRNEKQGVDPNDGEPLLLTVLHSYLQPQRPAVTDGQPTRSGTTLPIMNIPSWPCCKQFPVVLFIVLIDACGLRCVIIVIMRPSGHRNPEAAISWLKPSLIISGLISPA